jgi:hypothetical protein
LTRPQPGRSIGTARLRKGTDGVDEVRTTAAPRTAQPDAMTVETPPPASVRRMVQTVATVIGPATLVTALAFYFGWVSTGIRFRYFGVHISVLGLSLQDVILNATDTLFLPILFIVLAALVALTAHTVLIRWVDRKGPLTRWGRRILTAVQIVGALLFLAGLYAAMYRLPFRPPFLLRELSLGIGIALVAYPMYLRRRDRAGTRRTRPPDPEVRRLWAAGVVLVWVTIGLSVFWAASSFAAAIGRGRAMRMERELAEAPSVVIYSERDLHLQGPGVVTQQLEGEDAAYRYRYSGLTFLLRSGDKYFLVPADWERSRDGVIALPDNDTLRMEFVAREQ